MKTNYVLIDYENVQPATLSVLNRENFKILVFVGANQTKVPFEVAAALQHMGERAQYIKISGNGSNALDFHIAYYIGKIAAKEPDAYFHIISKDTGFDPLIQHLKSKKVMAARSADMSEIPAIRGNTTKEPENRISVIVADLKRRGTSKPRAVKTLTSTINSMFQKKLKEAEVSALLSELRAKGIIAITGTKVSYTLPS